MSEVGLWYDLECRMRDCYNLYFSICPFWESCSEPVRILWDDLFAEESSQEKTTAVITLQRSNNYVDHFGHCLHPWKLTWIPEISIWKRWTPLNYPRFWYSIYVGFLGCISNSKHANKKSRSQLGRRNHFVPRNSSLGLLEWAKHL